MSDLCKITNAAKGSALVALIVATVAGVAFAGKQETSHADSAPVTLECSKLPVGSKMLRGRCTTPDGKYTYLVHLLGRFWLPVSQVERGWCNCAALSVFDGKTGRYLNTVLLDDPDLGAADPWDVAVDDKTIAVAHSGTSEISLIDRAAFERRFEARKGSDLSADLTFMAGIRRRLATIKQGPRKIRLVDGKPVVTEYLQDKPGVTKGELVFKDARRCHQHWQSCASCHPGGGSDGLSWSFPSKGGFGAPGRTRDLRQSKITPEELYPIMLADFRADLFVDPDPVGARHLVDFLMKIRSAKEEK